MSNLQIDDIPTLTESGNTERFTRLVDGLYLATFLSHLRKASSRLLKVKWNSSDEFFKAAAEEAKQLFNADKNNTGKVTVSIESINTHGMVAFTVTEFLGDSLTRYVSIPTVADKDLVMRQTGNRYL